MAGDVQRRIRELFDELERAPSTDSVAPMKRLYQFSIVPESEDGDVLSISYGAKGSILPQPSDGSFTVIVTDGGPATVFLKSEGYVKQGVMNGLKQYFSKTEALDLDPLHSPVVIVAKY